MSVGGLIAGTHTFLVGVEDHGDGGLRLYLNHRALGLYTLIYDEEAKARVRAAWAGARQITVPVPPADAIYKEEIHA